MKLWKKILFIVVSAAILIYFIVAVSVVMPTRGHIECKKIEIIILDSDKNQYVTEQDVKHFLKQFNYKLIGERFKEIPMRKIELQLMENAAVCNAECYQSIDGTLLIKVSQRKPLFRVMSGNASYYVDSERKTMPTQLRHTAYVPVVTGVVSREFACNELYDFIQYIQDNSFLKAQCTQINVYPNNEVEIVPRVGSQRIYVGSLERYESKMKKLMIFYDEAMPKVGWDTYSQIDLRYKDQVICTRKE